MESVKGEFINMKKIVKIILPVVIVAAGFGMFKYSQKSLQSESAKEQKEASKETSKESEQTDEDEKTSQDYEGIQYDEDGFMMSPDELNADLPESTYEEIEADGAYEEAMDAEQEEEENEIHFDDGTATDISDSVTIESYPEYSSDISSDSDLSGENPASFFMSGE
jgi:uncharacterized protein YxeA